jgi:hypothetical protein
MNAFWASGRALIILNWRTPHRISLRGQDFDILFGIRVAAAP